MLTFGLVPKVSSFSRHFMLGVSRFVFGELLLILFSCLQLSLFIHRDRLSNGHHHNSLSYSCLSNALSVLEEDVCGSTSHKRPLSQGSKLGKWVQVLWRHLATTPSVYVECSLDAGSQHLALPPCLTRMPDFSPPLMQGWSAAGTAVFHHLHSDLWTDCGTVGECDNVQHTQVLWRILPGWNHPHPVCVT